MCRPVSQTGDVVVPETTPMPGANSPYVPPPGEAVYVRPITIGATFWSFWNVTRSAALVML